MKIRRVLPDEETFESLAARVRPLLLPAESVHHQRVLTAIQSKVDSTTVDVPADLTNRLIGLKEQWSKVDIDGKDVLNFRMQSIMADGTRATPQVSDTQLAGAWLYGDLVHVDARGNKSDGLLFPVRERYAAAVAYFAHAAVLSLMTLDLVMALHQLGVIQLDDDSLEADVVVGVNELVDESVTYVGPVGSSMPSLDTVLQEVPEDFHQLTVTELLRQVSTNQVQVVLTAEDGSTVGEYEAAVSRRERKEGRLHWESLVAGAVVIEASFEVQDDDITDGRLEAISSHATTNRLMLAEAMLAREMASSSEISFYVAGQKFFALDPASHTAEESAYIDVSIDTLYDLVAIEKITHQVLSPLTGNYTSADRALLRRTRLLWEGEIVPFRSSPLSTTAPAGVTPQVIVMPPTTRSIADTEVPVPRSYIRHPLMDAEAVAPIPDTNPPMDQMRMVIPSGEPFVAWAPDKRQVDGDEDLQHPVPWGLAHFDAQPFLGTHGQ